MEYEITFGTESYDRYNNGYAQDLSRWECTCGKKGGWSWPYASGYSKTLKRSARRHRDSHKKQEDLTKVRMQLVGRLVKERVANEAWITHGKGEWPNGVHKYDSDQWIFLYKNSNGWNREWGGYRHKEMAYAAALAWLDKECVGSYRIEMASEVDLDLVEIPLAPLDIYLTGLVNQAKNETNPKKLVGLRNDLEKAETISQLLGPARQAVEMKLVGLDPIEIGEIDDSTEEENFSTYTYTPST